jgi:Kef-type K+ transport system membrane component KefB
MRVLGKTGRAALAILALVGATAPAFAAGGEMPSLVHDIGIALLLSGVLAVLFARIKFPAIAGFILAGVIAGPLGLQQVTDLHNIDTIAQLGFVLLLFMIGLEIDLAKILGSGKTIVVTGLIQYPLTIVFGAIVANLLVVVGFASLIGGGLAPLYIGVVIAGSSTLIVVKLFQEAFELDTVPGRISLGILVFQDIWAIVVVIIQPSLQSPEILPIVGSFAGIAVLAGLAFAVSRLVMPVMFGWIAKMPELVVVGAISWCFAVVFVGTSFDPLVERLLGLELHLSVGSGMAALIAGATIANLPYSTEIVTKVGVVKDFFITLFFVGLGMTIPAPHGWAVPALAVLIALTAILARQLIFFPILYFTGVDQRNAEVTAVRLSQISEFGLVIAFLGVDLGHISPELSSAIIFAFVLTALGTTPLYRAAYAIHARLKPALMRLGFREPPAPEAKDDHQWRLALLGFHRVASSLLYDIARDDPPLVKETVVIDFNVALHDRIREIGAHVEYGDLSNAETLLHSGVDRARVVVSTVPDDLMRGTDNRRLVESVRRLNPSAIIIANAVNLSDCDAIYEAGADYVFLSRVETARSLTEVIGEALNGSLPHYRAAREKQFGRPGNRGEVLR